MEKPPVKRPLILVSVLAAMLATAAGGKAEEADGDACRLNRPFQVLNAQTGGYELNRVRGDRGWCRFGQDNIDDGIWTPDGADTEAAEETDSGETESPAK